MDTNHELNRAADQALEDNEHYYLDCAESAWFHSLITAGSFSYVSNPTPIIQDTLEKVFGPLDYNIPYV